MLTSDDLATASGPAMADFALRTTPHSIVTLQSDPEGVTLGWSDGRNTRLHVLWLRDNCACPDCRHPLALERTYIFIDHASPALISAALDRNGDLEVRFQQGAGTHVSLFLR